MSAILEVIIGIVFVYVILSILVTEINTIISNTLRLRANNLRDGLDHIIADPVMRAKIYSHPLIRLLEDQMVLPGQRLTPEQAEEIASSKVAAVDWIDSKTFVDVLLSTIRVDADQELFGAMLNVVDGMPNGPERRGLRLIINRLVASGEGIDDLREAIARVDQASIRNALTETIGAIDEEISQMGLEPNSIVSVMAGLRKVNNPYFRSALETILATAKTLDEAKGNIEKWFNDSMSRASSTFAVRMKTVSLVVAFFICVSVNIDSLHLARTLWEDPILRESVNSAAQSAVESGQLQQAITDAENANTEAGNAEVGSSDVIEDTKVAVEAAQQTAQSLNELRLPVGWTWEDLNVRGLAADDALRNQPNNIWNYFPGNNSGWLGLLIAKIIGIAATMIAVSQGAPFWFNILNQIMNRGKS